jgi:hypothetical protein
MSRMQSNTLPGMIVTALPDLALSDFRIDHPWWPPSSRSDDGEMFPVALDDIPAAFPADLLE